MMFLLVQLIFLTSCACAGAARFVVNGAQSFYQAEEKGNITLEWTFTTKPDSSSNHLYIYCEFITDKKVSGLYRLHEGVEVPKSQDEQFRGRVQCDKVVLREGRIRLHVSRLRTEDSGLYECEVVTSYGGDSGTCRLNVSAARKLPEPERPNSASGGRISIYWVLGLAAAAALLSGSHFLIDPAL